MSIYMTARFTVRPDRLDKAALAIQEFVAYVAGHEPGTRLYTALQQLEEPTSFLHYFIFENEAAMELHRTSPGVEKFTAALYPDLEGEVEFTQWHLLGSTAELA
jgi:quinol monooxygenase YgiN